MCYTGGMDTSPHAPTTPIPPPFNQNDTPVQRFLRLSRSIYWLFGQDEIWVTKDRRVLLLLEMSPHHLGNTIAYLERGAHHYHNQYQFGFAQWLGTQEMSDAVADDADRWLDELSGQDPVDWIRTTPLLQRMRLIHHTLSTGTVH